MAEDSILEDARCIVAAIKRAAPLAVVVEQVDGLRTHHTEVLRKARAALDALPYHWFYLEADGLAFGSTHSRARLLWVGVRVDVYVEPVLT